MESLNDYLGGCGKIYANRDAFELVFGKFSDLYNKVIPFLIKYTIKGEKLLDFKDLCKVAEIVKEKGHFKEEGLNEIRKIKKRYEHLRS
jgi:hypothetical protein